MRLVALRERKMSQLRNRPKSAQFAFFGLGLCGFILNPTTIGYQDFASRQAAPYQRTSFNQGGDITGSIPRNQVIQTPPRYQASDFPKVDRTLKGDRLIVAPPEASVPAAATPAKAEPVPSSPVAG